jgi:ribose/xylose/arabinose/galactoside ABC-type transport system permease subunit
MSEKTNSMEKETMSETKAKHIEEIHATQETPKQFGVALDKFITFAAVVVLFIFFSIVAKNFFTARSVLSLLLQTSAVTIMGIGVTFTIITGGIDLSIGSVIALSGTIAVMVAIAGVPIWLSMILGCSSEFAVS